MKSTRAVLAGATATVILATFAQAGSTPPACLLACVAQVSRETSQCKNDLSNAYCLCSNGASAMANCLEKTCPNGNAESAQDSFQSSCDEHGVKNLNLKALVSTSTAQPSSTIGSSSLLGSSLSSALQHSHGESSVATVSATVAAAATTSGSISHTGSTSSNTSKSANDGTHLMMPGILAAGPLVAAIVL